MCATWNNILIFLIGWKKGKYPNRSGPSQWTASSLFSKFYLKKFMEILRKNIPVCCNTRTSKSFRFDTNIRYQAEWTISCGDDATCQKIRSILIYASLPHFFVKFVCVLVTQRSEYQVFVLFSATCFDHQYTAIIIQGSIF